MSTEKYDILCHFVNNFMQEISSLATIETSEYECTQKQNTKQRFAGDGCLYKWRRQLSANRADSPRVNSWYRVDSGIHVCLSVCLLVCPSILVGLSPIEKW